MRRAMTWVYCDPKSKMTICSFMKSMKKGILCLAEVFGERKCFYPRPIRLNKTHGSSNTPPVMLENSRRWLARIRIGR